MSEGIDKKTFCLIPERSNFTREVTSIIGSEEVKQKSAFGLTPSAPISRVRHLADEYIYKVNEAPTKRFSKSKSERSIIRLLNQKTIYLKRPGFCPPCRRDKLAFQRGKPGNVGGTTEATFRPII